MYDDTMDDTQRGGLVERAAFPATEAAVAEARRWLRKLLAGHSCTDDAVLLLSETFTNSVVHTRSAAVGVVLIVDGDGGVQIEVIDEGAETSPCVCRHAERGDLTESGRGVRLLRALSSRWGFFEESPRCVVWFALDRPVGGR
ncbi:ATP-binding protein [Sphaerisporangium sp. TRM90804]|uniref:ATP-binding protein n=1 Tax=Sphaerisporangium sp. TRM90804 TaxID=3031113 RepID=UPI00244B3BB0|nr:ATP-binding protein [Sphaerisporangium sp. TRM90804]MDH2424178.1 ATP-binding protein [Sphaerisporangium sp. TRM90804]